MSSTHLWAILQKASFCFYFILSGFENRRYQWWFECRDRCVDVNRLVTRNIVSCFLSISNKYAFMCIYMYVYVYLYIGVYTGILDVICTGYIID